MPTMKERKTVAKLMLVIVNLIDEKPEFTVDQMRDSASEAITDAEEMLRTWGVPIPTNNSRTPRS